MTLLVSRPFEELIRPAESPHSVHTLIVGSGYAAAFAALALAMRENKSYANSEILVIERGNEFLPGDFPKTISDLPAHLSVQANAVERTGFADALFDVRVGENVIAIVGSGLGGTSLINAGVAVDPHADVFDGWPAPAAGGEWSTLLAPSLAFVREVLGTHPHPRGHQLPKVQALKRLAQRVGVQAAHDLADIAVSFEAGPNRVGVEQAACNDCGNCFTGCNIGAKNTLAMNAWPLARHLGVDIVTGGTVTRVRRAGADSGYAWIVEAQSTSDDSLRTSIRAKRVILAAGTFGSTEVLHRSRVDLGVAGNALGGRFSLNGDGISFGFGQLRPVQAHATVPSSAAVQPGANDRPGPTIVSVASMKEGRTRGLIEDATVPQAISQLWGEILSTQAMAHAYVSDEPSAWHKAHPSVDPLAVTPDLMQHHQVILGIGMDAADGTLSFDGERLKVAWPRASDGAAKWFHERLAVADSGGGFDGGIHLDNPFWRPLPERFDEVFEGASRFGATHLCNHPLGGCPMGSSTQTGAVDSSGRVFGPGSVPFDSLFVLDGSIIPGSLGINPLMTISALAHHLALQMDGIFLPESIDVPALDKPVSLPVKTGRPVDWPIPPLGFEFRERLFGPLDANDARNIGVMLGRPTPVHGLVIDATVKLPRIDSWLEDPSSVLGAEFKLYLDGQASRTIDTVSDEYLEFVAAGQGSVKWLSLVKPKLFEARTWRAVERFLALRWREIWNGSGGSGGFRAFMRVAAQHAQWRELCYEIALKVGEETITVKGSKRLAYDGRRRWDTIDEANPWTSLTRLSLEFSAAKSRKRARGEFRVDLVRMAKNLQPLQHTGRADTPQVVIAAARAGALFARAIAQTHLWSFSAPSYDKLPEYEEANRPRHEVLSHVTYRWEGKLHKFELQVAKQNGKWRLLRAMPRNRQSPYPVLLIHGLAHGSRVFCTETIDRSLAGHLLFTGHEVWLLDHGLSVGLPATDGPSIDEVAEHIAEALRHVNGATNQRVDVFSHCVGSGALTMAILEGSVDQSDHTPRIRSLAMHAVPPWIQPSESNLLRAYAGAFFKDRFFPDVFDPIPYNPSNGPDMPVSHLMLDRFASSLPWPKDDYELHSGRDGDDDFARTICNRMTALYGYEWTHANLDKRTHRHLASLVGPANVTAYRQLYYLLNRKRVTNAEGVNSFVRSEKFEKHWRFPTLFVHGSENRVFDVESARLSAHQLAAIQNKKHTVDLLVAQGYGHMDLLFGKDAWRDVHTPVEHFFKHGGRDYRPDPPKSTTSASTRLLTGPMISRPRIDDGRRTIRVWVESDEFQTSPVERIDFFHGDQPLPATLVTASPLTLHTNALKRSSFWLYDIECADVKGPVAPTVVSSPPYIKWVGTQPDEAVDWTGLPWFARFQAGTDDGQLTFVAGSCRYPGTWFDSRISDRVFERIRAESTRDRGIDHVLLVGDQIYADATYSLFDIAEHRERYQEGYRRAFGSDHAAWVLGHLPTYMAVDDHEFANNYETVSIFGGTLGTTPDPGLGTHAAQEAWNFQMHHGELPDGNNRLWYAFKSAGFDFFVFDTRSERGSHADPRHIIAEQQEQAFEAWLEAVKHSTRPLFLVTGSPLAPLPRDEVLHPARSLISDTLRAYPAFIEWLAKALGAAALKVPVVLVSGDPHFSALCQVEIHDRGKGLLCGFTCIVASGLNASLPFTNDAQGDYVWTSSKFEPSDAPIDVQVTSANLLSEGRAHALRIGIMPNGNVWQLEVEVIDADVAMQGQRVPYVLALSQPTPTKSCAPTNP